MARSTTNEVISFGLDESDQKNLGELLAEKRARSVNDVFKKGVDTLVKEWIEEGGWRLTLTERLIVKPKPNPACRTSLRRNYGDSDVVIVGAFVLIQVGPSSGISET